MPRAPNLYLPLSLLTLASLTVAAIVYGLLWKEGQRLRAMAEASAAEQSRIVAENVALTVAEAKDALMQALTRFDEDDLALQLEAWQQREPLTHFAFLLDTDHPDRLISFPDGAVAIDELQTSSGQWLWRQPARREEMAAPPAADYTASNRLLRQSIREQTLAASKSSIPTAASTETHLTTEWTHLHIRGELHWVGVAYSADRTIVRGVAASVQSLRPVILAALPPASSAAQPFNLLDADGNDPFAAYARYKARLASNPIFSADIGPELPGWTLNAARDSASDLAAIILSPGSLAAGAALTALFASGLWLIWRSRASQIDAARKVSFVSKVSHELKTPLTTIRIFSELLQSDRIGDPSKRQRYFNTISTECQRLTRMVNTVLDFSRLENGKTALNPAALPLNPFLREFMESRREQIEDCGFHLVVELDHGSEAACFDPDALAQVLGNLIDNSLKYAQQGKWLRLGSRRIGDRYSIEIEDRGPGLPKHLRKGSFDAFERGDDSLTASQSGFGLGLSIAQGLAVEMDGELAYRHPSGAADHPTFVLSLPIRQS